MKTGLVIVTMSLAQRQYSSQCDPRYDSQYDQKGSKRQRGIQSLIATTTAIGNETSPFYYHAANVANFSLLCDRCKCGNRCGDFHHISFNEEHFGALIYVIVCNDCFNDMKYYQIFIEVLRIAQERQKMVIIKCRLLFK